MNKFVKKNNMYTSEQPLYTDVYNIIVKSSMHETIRLYGNDITQDGLDTLTYNIQNIVKILLKHPLLEMFGIQAMRTDVGEVYKLRLCDDYSSDFSDGVAVNNMSMKIVSQAIASEPYNLTTKSVNLIESRLDGGDLMDMFAIFENNIMDILSSVVDTQDIYFESNTDLSKNIKSIIDDISNKTRRGKANIIYMSNDLITRLFPLVDFSKDYIHEVITVNVGMVAIKVFNLPVSYKSTILAAYKGKHGETDAGMYLSPEMFYNIDGNTVLQMGVLKDESTDKYYTMVKYEKSKKSMTEYQQHVIAEKDAIDKKAKKLSEFIGYSTLFFDIGDDEQERLKEQNDIMWQYSEILGQRIDAF